MCRAPTEIKTVPQTQAALPPDIATSHTGCCHYTHAVVTTPNGLLLRALVCCRIYVLNRNFKNIFQEYLSLAPQLHLLNVAAVSGGATSLEHGWRRRLRALGLAEEVRGMWPEQCRPALTWTAPLLSGHSYRSAQLASPSSSTRQWSPTQAQTRFQFCVLIF